MFSLYVNPCILIEKNVKNDIIKETLFLKLKNWLYIIIKVKAND